MNNEIIVAILSLLGLGYLYHKFKRNSVLADNVEMKEKLLTIDKEVDKLHEGLKTEETKREELKKDYDEAKKDVSTDELVDFFNKHRK